MLARAVDLVEAALRVAAALCLAGMAALVVAQVGLRYFAGGAPAFTEEVARYAMIWMALLATAVAVRERSHIRVEFLPLVMAAHAPGLGRAVQAVLDVLAVTIFLVLVWQGLDMVAFAHDTRSEGMRMRLSYPYAAVPVAFACASLFALARFVTRR
jgi:TRAP-type transport system small permease protein